MIADREIDGILVHVEDRREAGYLLVVATDRETGASSDAIVVHQHRTRWVDRTEKMGRFRRMIARAEEFFFFRDNLEMVTERSEELEDLFVSGWIPRLVHDTAELARTFKRYNIRPPFHQQIRIPTP